MNDVDEQIARLERILAKRIPISSSDVILHRAAKADPNRRETQVAAMMAGVARTVSEYVAENVLPILKELQGVGRRVSAIEDKGIRYVGIWQRVLDYKRGDICTCDGAMWIATVDSNGVKPGDGMAVWRGFVFIYRQPDRCSAVERCRARGHRRGPGRGRGARK
jgi:hypothetical protein